MKPPPVPLTESLFSVSRAWHERKDTVTGIGNHEKVSSHLQTGSVRSQGENSLTLFLLTVHHFVGKIAFLEFGFSPIPICSDGWYSYNLTSWSFVLTYAHTIVYTAFSVCHRGKTLVVKRVDHKSFLTLPKVCQGDSINHWQKYLAKLNTLPDTFCLSGCDGDSSYWHTGWGCLFGQARPTFYYCYTWHFLSYPS